MAFGEETASLLFRLRGDSSHLKKEMSDARTTVARELDAMDDAGKNRLTDFAKSLGLSTERANALSKALPVATAAIAGISTAALGAYAALFSLAKQAAEYGSEIKDAQEKTGLAAETLSALRYAAEQGGKSFESVETGIARFAKTVGEAANGSEKAEAKLNRLGIKPKEAINDLDGALAKVIKRIYEMPPGVEQMNASMDAFGKGGADLLVTINATNGDLGEFIKKARELGVVLSEEDVRAADEFGDMLVQVKAQMRGLTHTIGKEFMPIFMNFAKDTSEWAAKNKTQISDWSHSFAAGIQRVIDTIKGFQASPEVNWFFNALKKFDEIATPLTLPYQIGAHLRKRARSGALQDQFGILGGLDQPITDYKKIYQDAVKETWGKMDAKKSYLGETEKSAKKIKEASDDTKKNYKDIVKFAKEMDFTVTSQVRPKSQSEAHGAGIAADVRTRNKSAEEIANFILEALKKGFRVIDERTNILNSKKWTAPHLHLETNLRKPSVFNESGNYAGVPIELLKKLDEARRKKSTADDDVTKFFEERKREQEKQDRELEQNRKNRINAIRDEYAQIEKLDSAQAETRLKTLDSILKQGLIKEDEYARQVGQIRLKQLEDEKKRLEELRDNPDTSDDERKQIVVDLLVLEEKLKQQRLENSDAEADAIKKVTDEYRRQKEELEDLRRETRRAQEEAFEFQKEQERKVLVNATEIGSYRQRLNALVVLREFEIAESERRRAQGERDAEEERKRALDAIEDKEKEKEKVKEINDLYEARLDLLDGIRNAENKNTEEAHARAVRGNKSDQFGGGIFGDFMGNLAVITDPTVDAAEKQKQAIESLAGSYDFLKNVAGSAINSLISAGQDLLTQWILTGKGGAKALLSLAAATVSSIAIQAGIKAIFALAEGLMAAASFPWNPLGLQQAAMYYAAAKTYGLIAGGAAIAAVGMRAAIGDSFNKEKTANSSISRDRQSDEQKRRDELRTIEINRNEQQANQPKPEPQEVHYYHHHTLQVQSNDSHITKVVQDDIDGRGDLHGQILKLVEG